MAELRAIASVAQVADTGFSLSVKLYTLGEVVAVTNSSVVAIPKDILLTTSLLKELGNILDKGEESRLVSENPVQTPHGIIKECLEVFQDIESGFDKRLPDLGLSGDGKVPKAALLLERLRCPYLKQHLQLLQRNLARLRPILLSMLNVITYAR